jgi:LmbE family N-acetylglucosaminyl deacetylase
MTRYLYVFPHPDDESFGPALAIARQKREGSEVHLLTLTKGGATKQRHRLGFTVEAMGKVRVREMQAVAAVLGLDGMSVLDYPDSGLGEVDPRALEAEVANVVRAVRPDIIVTYPVHGVSGFPDHVVTHAAVKRWFCEHGAAHGVKRLAFFTVPLSDAPDTLFRLTTSPPELVDCIVEVSDEDVEQARRSLACYQTYAEIIEKADPLGRVGRSVPFEIFGERHDPPLRALDEDLPLPDSPVHSATT